MKKMAALVAGTPVDWHAFRMFNIRTKVESRALNVLVKATFSTGGSFRSRSGCWAGPNIR